MCVSGEDSSVGMMEARIERERERSRGELAKIQ